MKNMSEVGKAYLKGNEDKISSFLSGEHKILTRLKGGYAICILKEDTKKFLELLIIFEGIDTPCVSTHTEFTSEKNYFVLLANRIMHTDSPIYGGYAMDVYTPSI